MLNDKEIIKQAMGLRGISMTKFAEQLGYARVTSLAGILNREGKGMRTDNFFEMLQALGCTVIIKDTMGTKATWKLEQIADRKEEG